MNIDLLTLFADDGIEFDNGAAKPHHMRQCEKCTGTGKWKRRYQCFACSGMGYTQDIEGKFEVFADEHPTEAAWLADQAAKGNEFAVSLQLSIARYGKLTEKQLAAVQRNLSAPKVAADIDVSRIEVAFAAARQNGVKIPKLRLGVFVFSRAPDSGRNAGSIYVKANDEYRGKITAGKFYPVRECTDEEREAIVAVAAKPDEAAKAYGLRTGTCSCCGRTLTNGASIDLGIGPICAGKFGW